MAGWSGLGVGLSNLWRLTDGESRSITPENPTGQRGGGARAIDGTGAFAASSVGGKGWKVSPSVDIAPGATHELADIDGSGAIQHIWLTPTGNWRAQVLRIYWDDDPNPAVECPLGDFFCSWWQTYAPVNSQAITVHPRTGFNSWFEMPFSSRARVTVTNDSTAVRRLYYQIDYTLCDVPADAGRLCAQYRQSLRLPDGEVHTMLDGVGGRGHYVGASCSWATYHPGWWGEGEVKFFLDDDDDKHPTICGTGTEDYFCGSYNFQVDTRYTAFSGPFAGMPLVLQTRDRFQSRFGMYRFHVTDPIRFRERLKVNVQSLGWGADGRYKHLRDDISTVAYWYQRLPVAPFPALPSLADRLAD
jgi:Protein of unknown function (DUF2961)